MSWLSDIHADIASGNLREVSGEQHLSFWNRLCRKERDADAMAAINMANSYTAEDLHTLIALVTIRPGTNSERTARLCRAALKIKRERPARTA